MTAEEKMASLEAQLQQALEQRIEDLEKLKTPSPAFVKANKKKAPEEQKKTRKKRDARHNRANRAPQQPRSWSIGWSLAHSVISHRYYEYHHSQAGAVVKSMIGG